jgi:hypothetical protein
MCATRVRVRVCVRVENRAAGTMPQTVGVGSLYDGDFVLMMLGS